MSFIPSFLHDDDGASAVEYGLLLAVLVLALAAGAASLRDEINAALRFIGLGVRAGLG